MENTEPKLIQNIRKRAEAGDVDACYQLGCRLFVGPGILYTEGGVVEHDGAAARKWLRCARDLGHPDAHGLIESLDDLGIGQSDKREELMEKSSPTALKINRPGSDLFLSCCRSSVLWPFPNPLPRKEFRRMDSRSVQTRVLPVDQQHEEV